MACALHALECGSHAAAFLGAIRALFAAEKARFDELVEPWPPDIRVYARKLAAGAFAPTVE